MFCDGCGNELGNDQSFCARCGKEVRGIILTHPRPGRVQQHVRLLGILWIAFSAVNVVGGGVLFILSRTLFRHHQALGADGPPAFMHPFMSFIALVVLVKAAAGFIAGWGLLQRESWARVLTLIVASVALFHVPLGTALGVYSLWVLLPAESDKEYDRHARLAA